MSAAFDRPAAALLRVPAWLYRGVVSWRNRRYDAPGASLRAELPVISVGNVTLGGTGKTPLVQWLARRLLELGRRPAVLSRGYGGRAGETPLLVSSGDGPLVDATRCGDEPLLLARTLDGVGVIVDPRRPRGAAHAARLGYDVLLLDDGFQHRRLARDLDLVLLDARRPFGNGRLLPAGPLREPPSSLSRADALVLTGWRADADHDGIRATLHEIVGPGLPLLRVGRDALGWVDVDGADCSPPLRILAFCGIGNPHRFRDDLTGLGIDIVEFTPFRDHHRFTRDELSALAARAREHDAVPVTTEKDIARLERSRWIDAFGESPPLALRSGVRFAEGDAERLTELVQRALRGGDR